MPFISSLSAKPFINSVVSLGVNSILATSLPFFQTCTTGQLFFCRRVMSGFASYVIQLFFPRLHLFVLCSTDSLANTRLCILSMRSPLRYLHTTPAQSIALLVCGPLIEPAFRFVGCAAVFNFTHEVICG